MKIKKRKYAKRDKEFWQGGESPPAPLVEVGDIPSPPADKMIRNVTRVCPYCGTGSLSTICKCGRLTVFKNKIKHLE